MELGARRDRTAAVAALRAAVPPRRTKLLRLLAKEATPQGAAELAAYLAPGPRGKCACGGRGAACGLCASAVPGEHLRAPFGGAVLDLCASPKSL